MPTSRRIFNAWIWKTAAATALVTATGGGCGGGGPLSGEPKKYEGGGPIPEATGEEIQDNPAPKSKKR